MSTPIEGTQEYGIDDGEDRGIRSDSDGECEDDDEGEPWCSTEYSESDLHVLENRLEHVSLQIEGWVVRRV